MFNLAKRYGHIYQPRKREIIAPTMRELGSQSKEKIILCSGINKVNFLDE